MVAPLPAAVSSDIEPMEKALFTELTLSELGFPNEFPYEYDSSAFTSPGDSTETEEDETSDDEDDFFAGLTRRLALSTQRHPSPPPFVKAAEVNSTESTRSGLGSLTTSRNKSPTGPFSQAHEEDSLKVISAAAGEVAAKVKKVNLDSKPSSRPSPNPQNAAFGSYYYYYWLHQPPETSHYPIRFESTLQPALVAFPFPVRGVFSAPTATKQPSAGTGVFLPKNHRNPSDSGGNFVSGGGCVKLPTKVVQRQHLKSEASSGRCNSRSQACLSNNSNIPNLSSETHFPKLQ